MKCLSRTRWYIRMVWKSKMRGDENTDLKASMIALGNRANARVLFSQQQMSQIF